MLYQMNHTNQSSDNVLGESDLLTRAFGFFCRRNDKMKKINHLLNPFPIDLLLLSIDICQRVTCKILKINMLKIEKNEKTCLSIQNSQKWRFWEFINRKTMKRTFLMDHMVIDKRELCPPSSPCPLQRGS